MDIDFSSDEKYQGLLKKLNNSKNAVKIAEKNVNQYIQTKKIKMLKKYESLEYQLYEIVGRIVSQYLTGKLTDCKLPEKSDLDTYLKCLLNSAGSANEKKIFNKFFFKKFIFL